MRKFYQILSILIANHFTTFICQAQEDVNSFDRLTSYSTPRHITFGDINLDGITDMVGVEGNTSTDIKIYIGNGNNSFDLETTLDGGSGQEYYSIFLKNLNADDYPDIIAVSNVSGIIFMSDNAGEYSEVAMDEIAASYGANSTLFEDFNNDGDLDIFYNSRIHLNNGDGTFSVIDRTFSHSGVAAFDYNSDDNIDLIIGDSGFGIIQIFDGYGDGNYDEEPNLEFDRSPGIEVNEISVGRIIVHDFNNDDLADFIVNETSENEFIIFFNDETDPFTQKTTIERNHNFFSVLEIGDIDLDGENDIIGSDDVNIQYWTVGTDGSIGEKSEIEINMGSLRELHLVNAIGEDFEDLVVVDGFGLTRIYSDKINTELTQVLSNKIYDNKPFEDFYEVADEVDNILINYTDFEEPQSNAGIYSVTVSVEDDFYEGYEVFSIEILKRTLTVTALDVTIVEGDEIPEFELTYENFADGDNEASLTIKPGAMTDANNNSAQGEYEIVLSGGESDNYTFEFINGTLTIAEALSATENFKQYIYPNPTQGYITLEKIELIQDVSMINLKGKILRLMPESNTIKIGDYQPGMYILHILYKNGTNEIHKLLVK